MDGLISCCCSRGIRSRGPQGQNRAGDAILAAGKSCQAGLRGAERKQADADDRFRIPLLLIYRHEKEIAFAVSFSCCIKEGGMRRERPACGGKNHPVNGFLVPRAGGGTAPVPPGESLLLPYSFYTSRRGKSCQAGLRGAKRKQADADDRFRIPPLLTALPQCRRANPSFSRAYSLFPHFIPYRRGRENSLFSFPRISSIIYEGELPEKGYAKGVSLWI